MPRKPDPTLKPMMVDKVALHLRASAVSETSVRAIGRVLGTSAYPVVYHFGSREALIDAVVDRLNKAVTGAHLDPSDTPEALAQHFVQVFGDLGNPDRMLAARITFELGSIEALGQSRTHRELHRMETARLTEWCLAHGYDDSSASHAVRVAMHLARGTQWDAVIDHRDPSDVDEELRTIAHALASRSGIPVAP